MYIVGIFQRAVSMEKITSLIAILNRGYPIIIISLIMWVIFLVINVNNLNMDVARLQALIAENYKQDYIHH